MSASRALSDYILEYETGVHRSKYKSGKKEAAEFLTSPKPALATDQATENRQQYHHYSYDTRPKSHDTIEKLKLCISKLDSITAIRAHRLRQLHNAFLQDFETEAEFGESAFLFDEKDITKEEYNMMLFGDDDGEDDGAAEEHPASVNISNQSFRIKQEWDVPSLNTSHSIHRFRFLKDSFQNLLPVQGVASRSSSLQHKPHEVWEDSLPELKTTISWSDNLTGRRERYISRTQDTTVEGDRKNSQSSATTTSSSSKVAELTSYLNHELSSDSEDNDEDDVHEEYEDSVLGKHDVQLPPPPPPPTPPSSSAIQEDRIEEEQLLKQYFPNLSPAARKWLSEEDEHTSQVQFRRDEWPSSADISHEQQWRTQEKAQNTQLTQLPLPSTRINELASKNHLSASPKKKIYQATYLLNPTAAPASSSSSKRGIMASPSPSPARSASHSRAHSKSPKQAARLNSSFTPKQDMIANEKKKSGTYRPMHQEGEQSQEAHHLLLHRLNKVLSSSFEYQPTHTHSDSFLIPSSDDDFDPRIPASDSSHFFHRQTPVPITPQKVPQF